MKKHTLIVTLIAAALLSGASVYAQSTPSPSPSSSQKDGGGTRCTLNSASVEVHTFYGSIDTVKEKVAKMPVDLSERRVFLQITQSGRTKDATTDVRLFEKQADGSFAITEWTKAKAPGLFDEMDNAIITNKGKACVGEAMKAVLTKMLGTGKPVEPLAPPASPQDAFGPSVQNASGDFIKTVVIFGC